MLTLKPIFRAEIKFHERKGDQSAISSKAEFKKMRTKMATSA